ncbi:MAG: hypothetical protein ABIJ09_22770 [Pseudomonadota bacterium]
MDSRWSWWSPQKGRWILTGALWAVMLPILAVLAWGSYISCDSRRVQLQVRVDLRPAVEAGLLLPGRSRVWLKGSFDRWQAGQELRDPDGDLFYEGTLEGLVPGQDLLIKYVVETPPNWEQTWDGSPDRSVQVPSRDATHEDVFEPPRSAGERPLLPSARVTFEVDMGVQIRQGRFDPLLSQVELRADFNGWASGTRLHDPETDFVYSLTLDHLMPYQKIAFKFVFTSPETWEQGSNRELEVQSRPITYSDFFDRTTRVDQAGDGSVPPSTGSP